ncbi:ras-related protein Rab-20 isoform X2 [Hypanus sabinus]|uniref:ras-related protein Rab-20 isoform X2 n=1 Tax=Hypanus sabinus TaxID=79690 RepID=UPI0028C42862|nr:ras-related protein Rab-20 isoform X2 [Hypanus sabinus]
MMKPDGKVVILGDVNVGKSSLLQRYSERRFQDTSSTVGASFYFKHRGAHSISIWDTAGWSRLSQCGYGLFSLQRKWRSWRAFPAVASAIEIGHSCKTSWAVGVQPLLESSTKPPSCRTLMMQHQGSDGEQFWCHRRSLAAKAGTGQLWKSVFEDHLLKPPVTSWSTRQRRSRLSGMFPGSGMHTVAPQSTGALPETSGNDKQATVSASPGPVPLVKLLLALSRSPARRTEQRSAQHNVPRDSCPITTPSEGALRTSGDGQVARHTSSSTHPTRGRDGGVQPTQVHTSTIEDGAPQSQELWKWQSDIGLHQKAAGSSSTVWAPCTAGARPLSFSPMT